MDIYERVKPPFTLSTDRGHLDFAVVHDYLANQSAWAKGIAPDRLRVAIHNSITFGIYDETDQQVGFARVVSDTSTFAYVKDLFILPSHQKKGLGAWLVKCIFEHPELKYVRRWMLRTSEESQGFYEKLGFGTVERAELLMEKVAEK